MEEWKAFARGTLLLELPRRLLLVLGRAANVRDGGGGTLHTGFLGTSIVMETLTENGMTDIAYALLFNHKFPG